MFERLLTMLGLRIETPVDETTTRESAEAVSDDTDFARDVSEGLARRPDAWVSPDAPAADGVQETLD